MKTREFRIPLPMSLEEYHVAQLWAVNEQSRQETGGGEGVEVVKNEPFEGLDFLGGKYTKGQYTYKIYHVDTKVPPLLRTLLKTLIGSGGMSVHEEAWNAYPYCKTVITNPGYLKDDFKIVFETLHVDNDAGFTDNVLGMEDYEKSVEVVTLDIIKDKSSMTQVDAAAFKSDKAKRGPLDKQEWRSTQKPVMTCYKTVTVVFKWSRLLQGKIESYIQDKYKDIFLSFHQNVWCWTDQWFGMTMDDIRRLEADTKRELEDRIKDAQKRGNTKID